MADVTAVCFNRPEAFINRLLAIRAPSSQANLGSCSWSAPGEKRSEAVAALKYLFECKLLQLLPGQQNQAPLAMELQTHSVYRLFLRSCHQSVAFTPGTSRIRCHMHRLALNAAHARSSSQLPRSSALRDGTWWRGRAQVLGLAPCSCSVDCATSTGLYGAEFAPILEQKCPHDLFGPAFALATVMPKTNTAFPPATITFSKSFDKYDFWRFSALQLLPPGQ